MMQARDGVKVDSLDDRMGDHRAIRFQRRQYGGMKKVLVPMRV